jgi:hypothetical protein
MTKRIRDSQILGELGETAIKKLVLEMHFIYFEKATPVNSNSTETVTAAFDSCLGDVMRRVVDWTLQQGSAAARASL